MLLGEATTPHFYDFGIFGGAPEPQNQLFVSLETPDYLKRTKKIPWNMSKSYYFHKSHFLESPDFCQFRKRWVPENDEDPCNEILKILAVRSISIKNMKWKFGIMEQISPKSIKDF